MSPGPPRRPCGTWAAGSVRRHPAPVRRLFEVLAGPLAQPTTAGVRFGRFRTVSFDGCSSIRLADTERNVGWFGPGGWGGCPMLELMTLVETGTRSLIGAVFGPTDTGETAYARRLLHHLGPDMLLLWDRGFDANAFLAAPTGTGARSSWGESAPTAAPRSWPALATAPTCQ
jgi:hypothetical protein